MRYEVILTDVGTSQGRHARTVNIIVDRSSRILVHVLGFVVAFLRDLVKVHSDASSRRAA